MTMTGEKKSLLQKFEEATGVPSFKETMGAMAKIPDRKQLELLKEIIALTACLQKTDVNSAAQILKLLNEVSVDKLIQIERILRRVDSIIKRAPADLGDILKEIVGK